MRNTVLLGFPWETKVSVTYSKVGTAGTYWLIENSWKIAGLTAKLYCTSKVPLYK